MPHLKLTVLSLRYSSWSMRPWLVLAQAGADFETQTVELPGLQMQGDSDDGGNALISGGVDSMSMRRSLGSVHGLFPVLRVDGVPIHESLAICEYAADAYPEATLWPSDQVQRARARAISCEMLSGFFSLRGELSCHLFGRVPGFNPSEKSQADISRIFELWGESLESSGGPFLFGAFCIADAMYFPVLSRFRTYGIAVPDHLNAYVGALESLLAVKRLIAVAAEGPRIPIYDDYLRDLGGDPDGALTTS
jgi:glutathione S-transferase